MPEKRSLYRVGLVGAGNISKMHLDRRHSLSGNKRQQPK